MILLIAFNIISYSYQSNRWPNHDISKLVLLQLVHRHGDRSPLEFTPNDPYKEHKYWKTGIGHLTAKGKQRLYSLGQFIRREYNEYLGPTHSPRQVYARSSISSRCLESIQCLLSGAYPPKPSHWQWGNGSTQLGQIWQPIPVETFIPKNADIVLNQVQPCLAVDRQLTQIYNSSKAVDFLRKNRQFFEYLSEITGHQINSIKRAQTLHSTLDIEVNSGYYWSQVWTRGEEQRIVNQLYESHRFAYILDWDSHLIQRLRVGGLVKELNKNLLKTINNQQNNKKLFVYSTHDSLINGLMHSLNVFNGQLVPFGSTLMFKLHESNDNSLDKYFFRLYYLNDTDRKSPHPIRWTNCDNRVDCPLRQYFYSTKHLIFNDVFSECNAI